MGKLDKLKTLIPINEIEQEAQNQMFALLAYDFVEKVVICPDVHSGFTFPIGTVALLNNVISPAGVGNDIGCGMCYIETDIDYKDIKQKDLQKIYNSIYSNVPVGYNCNDKKVNYHDFKLSIKDKDIQKQIDNKLYIQLCTLGGGNHYIELGLNRNNKLCITIHCGSRNPGLTICKYYTNLSIKYRTKHLPNGFLDFNSEIGQAYYNDMLFMQQYALDNRKMIMETILNILGLFPTIYMKKMINENHNHADLASEYGENILIHRKGATPAELDQIGIIPANMRDGVYITRGLGNKEYLSSSSHGAGRMMSRAQAAPKKDKEKINKLMNKFKKQMEGIIANVSENTLDEAPNAYKDINMVIQRQEGIVIEVIDHIRPLINIKG